MNSSDKSIYEFGPFRLAAAEGVLLCGDEVVRLTPKAFEMLLVLVESSGHVLSKEELMTRVWPDTMVEEANLSHNIYKLREALAEAGGGERYIETLPRRGYRFVAKVRALQQENDHLLVAEHSRAQIVVEEVDTSGEMAAVYSSEKKLGRPVYGQQSSRRKQLLISCSAVVIIGLIVGLIYLFKFRRAAPLPGPPLRSIAVLPFKPLVTSQRNESLEIGMAETLITRLSSLNQIVVRPTSSVRKYTDPQQDSLVAGRELFVDSILDGNIQKDGDRLRVTARLVRVSDGATIWIDKFDTSVTDLFSVQDSISEKVVRALALPLTGKQQQGLSKRYTDSVEAYQLYLQGRYHWSSFKPDDMVSSINFYRAALEKDPNYALAYTGMAVSYITIGIYGPLSARVAGPMARDAARKAVDLDDELAEAHVALGVVKLLYEWDWEGAARELKRGIQLDPNTIGHTPYGYYLYTMGRWDEAIAELEWTSTMSPGWQTANSDVWWALYAARRYDEAARRCQQAITLDPNDSGAYLVLGQVQVQQRMYKEAIATLQQSVKIDGSDLKSQAELGYAYAISGDRKKALSIITELKRSSVSLATYLIAEIYAGLGDKDQAFIWLAKAFEDRFAFLSDVRITPQFDSLRSDSRYAALVRGMNLSP